MMNFPRRSLSILSVAEVRAVEALLQAPTDFLVKTKPHRQVYVINETPDSAGLVVKHFTPVTVRHALKAIFSPFPIAAREYWISRYFLNKGIPTAKPITWIRSANRVQTWYIGSLLPTQETVEDFLIRAQPQKLRDEILLHYANLLALLHQYGIYVDDFGPHNVLIRIQDLSPKLWIIDHEATRILSGYTSRCRLKNVRSALHSENCNWLSAPERQLFIAAYTEAIQQNSKLSKKFITALNALRSQIKV